MSETVTTRPRTLEISVLRHNPSDPASTPRLEHFEIEEAEGMTLFIALNEIRENQDPTLQFDFVCRAGICGACGMLIDGRPGLACRTLTRDLGSRVTLAPLPVFRLIGDLSVDTGAWMQGMAERLETWVHLREQEPDLGALEERMEPALAEQIYELERCIECGCCVAACATARMREDFVGAAGLNKIARFRLDQRDARIALRLLRLQVSVQGLAAHVFDDQKWLSGLGFAAVNQARNIRVFQRGQDLSFLTQSAHTVLRCKTANQFDRRLLRESAFVAFGQEHGAHPARPEFAHDSP